MSRLASGLDERIGGASAVDPRISRSLLRPQQRPPCGRRSIMAVVCLLVLGLPAAAHAAEPRPELPWWLPKTAPRPELPQTRTPRATQTTRNTQTTRSVSHTKTTSTAPYHSGTVWTPPAAPRAVVRRTTVHQPARAQRATRRHHPGQRQAAPAPAPQQHKGPYLFPAPGVWTAAAGDAPARAPLVLLGVAALVLAFGSGFLALTMHRLRGAAA